MNVDLDGLEKLRNDAAVNRAEAARLFDVSLERYRENRKATTREDIASTNEAYGKSIDTFVAADKAAREAEAAARQAAVDALPALIQRVRAAEEAADEFAGALSDYGDPNEERTKDAYVWCDSRRAATPVSEVPR